VEPGDPILASYLNRLEHSADLVLGQQQLGQPGQRLQLAYDTNRVTVYNNSGADRRGGEILEFDGGPLTTAVGGELWLYGEAVTLASGFGVLLQPIPAGQYGNRACQVAGACYALVNVTATAHNFARPVAGSHVLQSALTGPVRIVHKVSATGELVCLVLLSQATPPPRAYYTAETWDSGDNRIEFFNSGFREDSLTDCIDASRKLQILIAGDYMLTVSLNAIFTFGASQPAGVGGELGVKLNGGSLVVLDRSARAWESDAGGSPSHSHTSRAANLLFGFNNIFTVRTYYRGPIALAAEDELEFYFTPHSAMDISVLTFAPSLGNSFVELEPLL